MSIGGLASGLDTNGIIDQLMALERRPIALMQQRQLELEKQKGAWRDVNSRLRNLEGRFSSLKLESTYLTRKATSSDDKVVTASTTAQAADGRYNVEVVRLATGMTQVSNAVDSANTALSSTGTITIGQGEKSWEIEVGINDSLNAIAKKINAAKGEGDAAAPVTASVVANRLVLSSKTTGSESSFTVNIDATSGENLQRLINQDEVLGSNLSVVDRATAAQNGKVRINGIEVDDLQNNTLRDVIQGVTLEIKQVGTSTLTISQDTKPVVDAVQAFVDQYNSLMGFIDSKLESKSGDLRGDTSLMRLQSSLRQMMTNRPSHVAGKYTTLGNLGISTGSWVSAAPDTSGRLTLDTAKLEAALKADPLAVKNILYKQTNVLGLDNVAVSATSSYDGVRYPLESLINGVTDSTNWAMGEGWASGMLTDAEGNPTPQSLTLNLGAARTLDSIRLFTLDTPQWPAAEWGVSDYKLFYTDQNNVEHLLAEVTENTRAMLSHSANGARATSLRFEFSGSNQNNDNARVVEVEAFESSGIFYNLERYIRDFTRAGDGILTEKDKSYDRQIKDIKDQVERMESRLELRQQTLVAQFTALEKAMASMQQQSTWLSGQVNQLNNMYTPRKS